MKSKTKKKSKIIGGIIPSQNAIRWCASMLRRNQHRAMMEAILSGRLGDEQANLSYLEQADDYAQVAQYLEERLLK